jgi:hypothetical protein
MEGSKRREVCKEFHTVGAAKGMSSAFIQSILLHSFDYYKRRLYFVYISLYRRVTWYDIFLAWIFDIRVQLHLGFIKNDTPWVCAINNVTNLNVYKLSIL